MSTKSALRLLIAFFGLALSSAFAQTGLEFDAKPIERLLSGTHSDEFTINLKEGEFYAVTAFQESVDVIIDVYSPDGKRIASVDITGINEPDEWDATATASGTYRIVVRRYDPSAPDGKYTMAVRSAATFSRDWAKENIKSPRVRKVWDDLGADPHAAELLAAERKGKGPLVEPGKDGRAMITFVYHAPPGTSRVQLSGGPTPDGHSDMMTLGNSGVWYVTIEAPKDSRFVYQFNVTTSIRLPNREIPLQKSVNDPLNPATSVRGSVLVLDDAPKQPFDVPVPAGQPAGSLTPLSVDSKILKEKRTYSVWTPPGFDATKGGAYGIVFVFDGEMYGSTPRMPSEVDLPRILANASNAGKLRPQIFVLVNNMGRRNRDLPCYKPFADFMALELLPAVRAHFPAASPSARRVIVSGSSYGGLASTYCALTHPEAFGNVLSLSGSYWVPNHDANVPSMAIPPESLMTTEFMNQKHLPIRFYLDVGTYEGASSQLRTNRHLRDVLRLKGYDLTYHEFDGNHDAHVWKRDILDGLSALTRDWGSPRRPR